MVSEIQSGSISNLKELEEMRRRGDKFSRAGKIVFAFLCVIKTLIEENQDGGVGRHTAPPRTTRTDRELNSKGDQHQGNRK